MKTKRFAILLVLCSATSFNYAQGLYFGLGGGYGFAAAKQSLGDDVRRTSSPSAYSAEYTAHPISIGKGINAGLFAGYMFNPNLGLELGVSYLAGSKNILIDEYNGSSSNTTYKGSMFRLIPTIRLTAGDKKLRPYMKAGLIVGLGGKVTNDWVSSNSEEIWEYSGGICLGFHGGIGLSYALNDKLSLFGEMAANYQSYAPTKGSLIKDTNNGIDQLPNQKTYFKEIEYVDSYTVSGPADQNAPRKELKTFMPFSSIGINIGIVYTMGSSK